MQQKGFFQSLFDLSFSSFITTKIIKVLYVIAIILTAIAALGYIIWAFTENVGFGLVMLIVVAPLVSLLYIIYARVFLEILIVIFRIMETNTELVHLQRQATAGPPPQVPTPQPPQTPPPPPTPPTPTA